MGRLRTERDVSRERGAFWLDVRGKLRESFDVQVCRWV